MSEVRFKSVIKLSVVSLLSGIMLVGCKARENEWKTKKPSKKEVPSRIETSNPNVPATTTASAPTRTQIDGTVIPSAGKDDDDSQPSSQVSTQESAELITESTPVNTNSRGNLNVASRLLVDHPDFEGDACVDFPMNESLVLNSQSVQACFSEMHNLALRSQSDSDGLLGFESKVPQVVNTYASVEMSEGSGLSTIRLHRNTDDRVVAEFDFENPESVMYLPIMDELNVENGRPIYNSVQIDSKTLSDVKVGNTSDSLILMTTTAKSSVDEFNMTFEIRKAKNDTIGVVRNSLGTRADGLRVLRNSSAIVGLVNVRIRSGKGSIQTVDAEHLQSYEESATLDRNAVRMKDILDISSAKAITTTVVFPDVTPNNDLSVDVEPSSLTIRGTSHTEIKMQTSSQVKIEGGTTIPINSSLSFLSNYSDMIQSPVFMERYVRVIGGQYSIMRDTQRAANLAKLRLGTLQYLKMNGSRLQMEVRPQIEEESALPDYPLSINITSDDQ